MKIILKEEKRPGWIPDHIRLNSDLVYTDEESDILNFLANKPDMGWHSIDWKNNLASPDSFSDNVKAYPGNVWKFDSFENDHAVFDDTTYPERERRRFFVSREDFKKLLKSRSIEVLHDVKKYPEAPTNWIPQAIEIVKDLYYYADYDLENLGDEGPGETPGWYSYDFGLYSGEVEAVEDEPYLFFKIDDEGNAVYIEKRYYDDSRRISGRYDKIKFSRENLKWLLQDRALKTVKVDEMKIHELKEETENVDYPHWMPELLELFATSVPTDDDVHDFAEEYDIDPHELEDEIYKLLHAFSQTVQKGLGKHNDVDDDTVDGKELEMGIEVEMEHTNNPFVARLIAKDHLAELPDYYTRLKKMEGE